MTSIDDYDDLADEREYEALYGREALERERAGMRNLFARLKAEEEAQLAKLPHERLTLADLESHLRARNLPAEMSVGTRLLGGCPSCSATGRRGKRPFKATVGRKGILVYCEHGCSFEDIANALRVERREFFYDPIGKVYVEPDPHRTAVRHGVSTLRFEPSSRHKEPVRRVVEDVAERAEYEAAMNSDGRFAYGQKQAAERLGVEPIQVKRAIDYLVKSGQILVAGLAAQKRGDKLRRPHLYRLPDPSP
jgi:hypothetical protein